MGFASLLAVSGLLGAWGGVASERGTRRGVQLHPPFAEPVTLSSVHGVLEVTLTARQGTAHLTTVASPVKNFFVFDYRLIRGSASNGKRSGENLYPAPTLRVNPGEKLVIHLRNALRGLTVRDFMDPSFTPRGQHVPLYRRQLTSAPLNLHTHGLHVSPRGNSDNVLLDIPAGYGNTYTYRIPRSMPDGLYWYHSHRHQVTSAQTYGGLAGMLEIGRPDGRLPAVTQHHLPVRTMALQYDYVFDRAGGLAHLNNPDWPQYVSTLKKPEPGQLKAGTYEPKLTPVNFSDSAVGTRYFTNWYAGHLAVDNERGQFQFFPSNLETFTAGDHSETIPADPSLLDAKRDLQYTVNGRFQPVIHAKPGQTEIWALANMSDFAYMSLAVTNTATGRHVPFEIIGQDGNPAPRVHHPVGDPRTLVLSPASRFAIAVTMPNRGGLSLEMPPLRKATALHDPGILYTNNGTNHPPAKLGTISIRPSAISYFDGFFSYPTQKLLEVKPIRGRGAGTTVRFTPGQRTGAYTSFFDAARVKPDVRRTFVISGGFHNTYASKEDPLAFVYEFDKNTFPNVPLIQPRLGSVEQWTYVNNNNDQHPIHIHVNDFQVMRVVDAAAGTASGPEMWGEDTENVPSPKLNAKNNVTAPGVMSLRTKFIQFTGTYVVHCHRLNHEDNGLMEIVNVIPAVSSYAVAQPGSAHRPARVRIYDQAGNRRIATVTPFPGFHGIVSVAMGDVNGDQVLDLVAGTGQGAKPMVVAYSGRAAGGHAPFRHVLARFRPFDVQSRGGVSVAAADIDGNPLADNIVVGSGPGTNSEVKVFSTGLPRVGTAPSVWSSFTPYTGSKSGVQIATGLVDAMSGRQSIVTAPGQGEPARIKTFRYDLFTPNGPTSMSAMPGMRMSASDPAVTSNFLAFPEGYTGGVSLATGWVAGGEGGAQSIIAGQLASPGRVRIYSSGSALDGEPTLYLMSPDAATMDLHFSRIADFVPTRSPVNGVTVATTSTLYGADLLTGTPRQVTRWRLERPARSARHLKARLLGRVQQADGHRPSPLAGR